MVQQKLPRENSTHHYLINAQEAFRRLRAGLTLTVERDYGPYTETITALSGALERAGSEGFQRAFTVLKRADAAAAELEHVENPYALDLDLSGDDLAHLDRFPYTDFGQGEAFAYLYKGRMLYAVGLGWLIWSGLRWQSDSRNARVLAAGLVARARQEAVLARKVPDGDKTAESLKNQDMRKAISFEHKARIEAAIKLAESQQSMVVDAGELDADPYLLCARNAVVDLRTGEALPPDPDYLITKRTDIDYIPDAPCPRWERFLREVFENNGGLIDYLQRAIGYMLTGLTKEDCFFVHYGTGRNGKGTIAWILEHLGGEYTTSTDPRTFEARKESGTGEELAVLRGMRIVIASEPSENYRLNEGRIKALTGQDVISTRHLYGHRFTYRPPFKINLLTNHKPRIDGNDQAIWSRVRLLPYNVTFRGREDKDLKETLLRELPGIFAWAVRGAQAYFEQGLAMDDTIAAATEAYRAEQDLIGQWIAERVIEKDDAWTTCGLMHDDYKRWADDMNIKPISQIRLGRILKERGWVQDRRTAGTGWRGRGLLL